LLQFEYELTAGEFADIFDMAIGRSGILPAKRAQCSVALHAPRGLAVTRLR
jgi:hypothetical protein